MPALLVLVLVGVPLLELVVILQVGGAIGGWSTAALLIVFSIVGAMLLRVEGRRAWSEFRLAMSEGRWPGDEVAQGALIIVGGTLLVTPGFLTDLVGFLLLIGPSRRLVARRVRSRLEGSVTGVAGTPHPGGDRRARGPGHGAGSSEPGILDVEVVEIRREQPPGNGPTRPSGATGSDDDVVLEPDDPDDVR